MKYYLEAGLRMAPLGEDGKLTPKDKEAFKEPIATFVIDGTEEEIVRKLTRNLLCLFSKVRENTEGATFEEELKTLIKKYNL